MIRKMSLIFFMCFLGLSGAAPAADHSSKEFQSFLKDLKKRFAEYGWTDLKPEAIPWEYHRTTNQGRPLFFADFGNDSKNCTLLIAAVYGDEIPTAYVLFKLADYLKENPEAYKGRHLVIAPLINPDGFLASPPSRINSQGVDINRNFPTRDWRKAALKQWKGAANGSKRYYPRAETRKRKRDQVPDGAHSEIQPAKDPEPACSPEFL
jgi:protein MpaA